MTQAAGRKGKDNYQERARELCLATGVDPDFRVDRPGERSIPAWCQFLEAAQSEHLAKERAAVDWSINTDQSEEYRNSPLTIFGDHEDKTIEQMRNCMKFGNVVKGVIAADGHLGYAQPVGGVIAYKDQISISGVGFDIGCGNMAVQLNTPAWPVMLKADAFLQDIRSAISFGVGRTNDERVKHPLFDDDDAWEASGMKDYKDKAISQLGTVGSGNHYVDLFADEAGMLWIGVHFGSRGLGHTTATRYLKAAGGREGINVPPAIVHVNSELGIRYLEGMELAGRYAYAGREWVVERVRAIVGGDVVQTIHNHHNYAWMEPHDGDAYWVVRKGATPAFPNQRGFIGGSMGDNAVIVEGIDSERSKDALFSTVHGAGRLFGRMEAKRRFTRTEWEEWMKKVGVTVSGGDLDESPMAYRRLPEVLAHHAGTIKVLHTLKPFAVAMAGNESDPFKD